MIKDYKKQFSVTFICLLTLIINSSLFAQNKVLDSLEKVVVELNDDTAKVSILIAIADNSKKLNPERSKEAANLAMNLSHRLNFHLGIGRAHYVLGKMYHLMNDFQKADSFYNLAASPLLSGGDSAMYMSCIGFNGRALLSLGKNELAIDCLKEGLLVIEKCSDREWIFNLLIELSNTYKAIGVNKLSVPILERCIHLAEELEDERLMIIAINNMGNALGGLGEVDMALELLYKALQHFQNKGDNHDQAIIHMNIGKVYGGINDLDQSYYHYYQAYILHDPEKNLNFSANLRGNLGNVMIRKKEIDSALVWINQAIEISLKANHNYGVASFHQLLGEAYYGQDKIEDARASLLTSLAYFDEVGYIPSRISVRRDLADVYIKQKKYGEAEKYLMESLEMAKFIETNAQFAKVYGALYFLESERGNYKAALDFHLLYKAYSDSILNEERVKSIEKLRVEHDILEKEQELAMMNGKAELQEAIIAEKESRNALLIALIVLIMMMSIFAIVMVGQRRRNQSKTRELKSKLYALRSQVNPHFIFNSLTSIYNFMEVKNDERARDYLLRFSKLMRMTLDHTRSEMVDLESEFEYLRLYLDVEQERLQGKFDYNFKINESLDMAETLIPPMMIQPFLENAIWHGISLLNDRIGLIHLEINEDNNYLVINIKDNGIGMPDEQAKELTDVRKHPSHGIQITRERIELLNQKYKRNGGIKIENLEVGVSVEVKIPIS